MQQAAHPIDAQATAVGALTDRFRNAHAAELRVEWYRRLRAFWRLSPALYRALTMRLVGIGEYFLALEVAEEGRQFFGEDPTLVYWSALALARSGSMDASQALLETHRATLETLPDYPMLQARLDKDRWRLTGKRNYLTAALARYDEALQAEGESFYYPAVNAATVALLLGEENRAHGYARQVLAGLPSTTDGVTRSTWEVASLAEAHLVLGDLPAALSAYHHLVNDCRPMLADRLATRAQAKLVLAYRGESTDMLKDVFDIPSVAGLLSDGVTALSAEETAMTGFLRRERVGSGIVLGDGPLGKSFLTALSMGQGDAYPLAPEPQEEGIPEALRRGYMRRLLLGYVLQQAAAWETPAHLLIAAAGAEDIVNLAAGSDVQVHCLSFAESVEPTPTADGDAGLFSALHFGFADPDTGDMTKAIAAALQNAPPGTVGSGLRHRALGEHEWRAYLADPAAALVLAGWLTEVMPPTRTWSIGLHAGPMRLGTHPATGRTEATGRHATRGDWLPFLASRGQTFASAEFVALARVYGVRGWRFEYLGRHVRTPDAEPEIIFQVRPAPSGKAEP